MTKLTEQETELLNNMWKIYIEYLKGLGPVFEQPAQEDLDAFERIKHKIGAY